MYRIFMLKFNMTSKIHLSQMPHYQMLQIMCTFHRITDHHSSMDTLHHTNTAVSKDHSS